jgi:hypothetical protein
MELKDTHFAKDIKHSSLTIQCDVEDAIETAREFYRKSSLKGIKIILSDSVYEIQKQEIYYSYDYYKNMARWKTKYILVAEENAPFTEEQKDTFLEHLINIIHDDGRSQVDITKFT